MAEPQPQNSAQLRKKRKKSRYVKQGYHRSERDDYRRVAARAFLLGITRDSHLRVLERQQSDRGQAPAADEGRNASPLAMVVSPTRKGSIVPAGDAPSPPSTPVLEARYFPTFKIPTTADMSLDPSQLQFPQQLGASRSLDQGLGESQSHHRLAAGIRTSRSSTDYTDSAMPSGENHPSCLLVAAKWPTTAEGAIYQNLLPNSQYYETGRSWRLVCTGHTQTVVSVSSVLPYYKKNIKSRHETQRERFRARGNSFSLQMDLEGVELGTTTEEVSLAFLLNSVWISPDVPILTSDLDGPALLRRGSIRRSAEVNVAEGKRSSTPTPLARYLVTPEVIGGGDSGSVFRGDHRSPLAVILSYHPLFLNNDELFASPMTTTLTPPGYRAS
ncbi:hypothetical protein GBAR_LOCUS9859 [Geodia barretti]|uniref:Uncharacterized protein n=1 Tax=Geodia barretti TaxID=519541 RepID=A0AA35WG24_GEOBA|nr:hypothetical protein GBAR_LOCUS9859 [Geodia barretti]